MAATNHILTDYHLQQVQASPVQGDPSPQRGGPALGDSTPNLPLNPANNSAQFQNVQLEEMGIQRQAQPDAGSPGRGGPPVHPREGWPRWRWPLTWLQFYLASIIVGYDVSAVANIQSSVFEAFGRVELLTWMALGASAANASSVVLMRWLFSAFDAKHVMTFFNVLLILGAIVGGTAQTMNAVIISRIITGTGVAGCYQSILVFNVALSLPHELPRTQGGIAACYAIGLVLGPIVGGAFAQNEHATWRWAFYISLPTLALLLALGVFVLPPLRLNPDGQTSAWRKLAGIDWIGFALHCTFVLLLCAALAFSGSLWPWHSASAIAAWAVVGVVGLSYARQQVDALFTTPARRIFPVDLLAVRSVVLCTICTACAASAYGVTLYYTPLFFAFARGFTPLSSATHVLPFIGTFIALAMIAGGLMPRVGTYAPFYIVGGALVAVGAGLLTTVTADTPVPTLLGYQVPLGGGTGMMWQTGVAVVAEKVPPSRRLDATAVFVVFQMVGIAASLAVAGCVFQNVGFQFLRDAFPAGSAPSFTDAELVQALAGVDSPVLAGADPEVTLRAVVAVTSVIARLFWIVVGGGVLAFACGCLMDFERLHFGRGPAAAAAASAASAVVVVTEGVNTPSGAVSDGEKAKTYNVQ